MSTPEITATRRCVFCGAAGKMSGEHIWPEWISKLLPEEAAREVVTLHVADSHLGRLRSYQQRIFQMRVKGVCEPCNGGWMSRLESAVKPLIGGMLLGRRRLLHPTGQGTLAAWAVLKVMMMQHAFPREIIPVGQYAELYAVRDDRRPPHGFRVYTARVAHTEGRAEPGFFHCNGIARVTGEPITHETPAEGYLATFTVLDLLVQVFRAQESIGGDDAEWIHPRNVSPAMRRLWPEPSAFTWGAPTLTASGVAAVSGAETMRARSAAAS